MRYALACMALLAACQDRGVKPRQIVSADSADQVYDSMTFFITRDGIKVSRVQAESAFVYQSRQVADLLRMTVTSYDTNGAAISTIVADKGIYGMKQQSLDARGNVVAHSSGGKVLKTAHLVFDRALNQISSDSPFTSTAPEGNISGAYFVADPSFKNVVVTKVRAGQKGKGILLPGQHGPPAK